MNNRDKIMELFSKCTFDGMLYSEVAYEKILTFLPEDFEYDWHEGASKLVIVPHNENYVIKIPYNGAYYSCSGFEEFLSANSAEDFFWDYCFTETLIWRLAKAENVHKAFAKERMIGIINNHPIYIQQRVEVYANSDKYNSNNENKKEKTEKYCREKDFRIFSLSWQTDAFEYYGSKQFDKIMSFIENYDLRDFHNSNLGYIGQRPVFLDYSDFNEQF